jgi:hypothetical protein
VSTLALPGHRAGARVLAIGLLLALLGGLAWSAASAQARMRPLHTGVS